MMYIMMKNVVKYGPKTIDPDDMARINPNAEIYQLRWHVGMGLPFPLNSHNIHLVVAVQADCDELYLIQSTLKGFPTHQSKSVQTWRGESA